jgi:exopolysaccharide biosynthesis polyprenyl glycosylphosphotransferase
MDSNGLIHRHWFHVTQHFILDVLIFFLSFFLGTTARFGADWQNRWGLYLPAVFLGAIAFACAVYILGLYSPRGSRHSALKRSLLITLCLLAATLFMLGLFYINYSTRIGRGVMAMSWSTAWFLLIIHHFVLHHLSSKNRERVAVVVGGALDEAEAKLAESFSWRGLEFVGTIHHDAHDPSDGFHSPGPVNEVEGRMLLEEPSDRSRSLGPVSRLHEIVRDQRINRIICTHRSMNHAGLHRVFCQLRYSGVTVSPLISLCEEVDQRVPLELVTPDWLLGASAAPHMFYIKKIKRGFDVAAATLGLLLLWPILAIAMLVVALTSRGSIFYCQTRSGRFGRPFRVIKLRTMQMDAEPDGPAWTRDGDPRVTPVGRFLRKYRIDEIPQLINVLRGEMSFVGPRPERPEFIEQLSREIPSFQERVLAQPGITGWAQVNYPYGNSAEDARRKLEYDLYYLKHMSVLLDIFILLDTVRIILRGGLTVRHRKETSDSEALAPSALLREEA